MNLPQAAGLGCLETPPHIDATSCKAEGCFMQCKRCGAPLQRGAVVCPACGVRQPKAPVLIRCRQCGSKANASLRVCPHCGQDLKPARLPARRTIILAAVVTIVAIFGLSRLSLGRAGDVIVALLPQVATPTLVPETMTITPPAFEPAVADDTPPADDTITQTWAEAGGTPATQRPANCPTCSPCSRRPLRLPIPQSLQPARS